MRPVHGDGRLCTDLWRGVFEAGRGEIGFAKLLAEAAGGVESGLGFFGRFKRSSACPPTTAIGCGLRCKR